MSNIIIFFIYKDHLPIFPFDKTLAKLFQLTLFIKQNKI